MTEQNLKKVPIAIVMISLNEAHNLDDLLQDISEWAQEIFLVDSCSVDKTVDIALHYGVHVVQREFSGFGDQWNFAINTLPITAPWTMKLDPDERLTKCLKTSIESMIQGDGVDGISMNRRLWFMGKVLPVKQPVLRVWRSGKCQFTDVLVNEHPIVEGNIKIADGYLEHRDSPNLDHWILKQNKYTSAEAIAQFMKLRQPIHENFFGSSLERRMWLKRYFWKIPGRYICLFIYHYILLGAWKAGKVGWIWSHMRVEVYRLWEYKYIELQIMNGLPLNIISHSGAPDPRVPFFEQKTKR